MKKKVLIMLFMVIAASSYAQNVTKNNLPKNLKGARMNLRMDFSDALIPGWSSTGGPWVKPEDAMKKLTWRTKEVTGGKEPPFMIGTKLARMKIWATVTGKKLGSILKSELPNK